MIATIHLPDVRQSLTVVRRRSRVMTTLTVQQTGAGGASVALVLELVEDEVRALVHALTAARDEQPAPGAGGGGDRMTTDQPPAPDPQTPADVDAAVEAFLTEPSGQDRTGLLARNEAGGGADAERVAHVAHDATERWMVEHDDALNGIAASFAELQDFYRAGLVVGAEAAIQEIRRQDAAWGRVLLEPGQVAEVKRLALVMAEREYYSGQQVERASWGCPEARDHRAAAQEAERALHAVLDGQPQEGDGDGD